MWRGCDVSLTVQHAKPQRLEDVLARISALETTVSSLESTVVERDETIVDLRCEIGELKHRLFGQKSERQRDKLRPMPSVKDALAALAAETANAGGVAAAANGTGESSAGGDGPPSSAPPNKGGRARRRNIALPERHRHHEPKACSRCSSNRLTATDVEDASDEIEFVPAHFIRIVHHRHRKRCLDCEHIVHAPPAFRPEPSCAYGVGVHAHVAVSKCADSMPVHRLAQSMARHGLHANRSSLNDLFHRTADKLEPIYARLLELLRESGYVNADETPINIQAPGKCKRGFVWTFLAEKILAYVFASTRSGEVPRKILGDSTGKLQADAHSGYNSVCTPDKRERVGCLAHVRRKFWEAKEGGHSAAQTAIDLILKIYKVEYDAAERGVLGTPEHGELRKRQGRRVLVELFVECRKQKNLHPPRTPLGKAARYALNNWRALRILMDDPKLRLDNNVAEGALRIIALGRKNFLFVGNNDGGHALAVLQTIVATCKANGVNPFDYIVDVMPKVAVLPPDSDNATIDALLPMNWQMAAA